jgi:uncharacterized protein YlxP (DUF503 family)
VTIGVYSFELHLPMARSLKEKRKVVHGLKGRLRSRHNVAVSEIGEHADLWQRASIAVVSVAASRDPLVRLFEAVHRDATAHVPGEVIETGTEFIDAADGGPGGWEGEY